MPDPVTTPLSIDALAPPLMAKACEDAGVTKAGRDTLTLLLLGILAGAFIALGSLAMIVLMTGASGLPWGLSRALGGIGFSLGLILVIVGGAELFTGDCLMIVARASRRISTGALLRAWVWVYLGNLLGAAGTAVLLYAAGHYLQDGGMVGKTALSIATAKAALPTTSLFFLSVLCNVLVCLAVWMSLAARSTIDRVVVIVPAVMVFVAAGFEHSIANAFFLPYGLLIRTAADPSFWTLIGQSADAYSTLTGSACLHNIAIATIGNLLGGSLLVGGIYWMIYLRRR
jgi:formate/nitrite transporter